MTGVSYTTRGSVLAALSDRSDTARGTGVVDQAIEAGSRAVDQLCHRVFYPTTATRSLLRESNGQHLWLDADEVRAVTSLTVDGTLIPASEYTPWPASAANEPYTSLRFDGVHSFTRTSVISLAAEFGASNATVAAGAAAEAIDGSETDIDVSDASLLDVGDTFIVDSERMTVTGRTWLTSAQTLQTPLAASAAGTSVAVTTGSAYHPGEEILLDAERMLITDIAGNTLVVKRAYAGTVLATHTGSTIYVPRTLQVVRGVLGSTVATHLTAAPLTKLQAPALVRALALAEACQLVLQQTGGYSSTLGSTDNSIPAVGSSISTLRQQVYAEHGRKGRQR